MEIFKGQNLLEFSDRFKDDLSCKEYLSELKWEKGYKCVKCGHKSSQQRKDFSRTCNRCSHTESSTANTLFHKVKFGLRKAFFICFEMATTTKSLSASYMSVRYGITESTARLFMHKVREAMKSSENNPMDGTVDVEGIDVVINFNVPHDADDYVHRIGRTARAERTGTAITFINQKDQRRFADIERLIDRKVEKCPLPEGCTPGHAYKPQPSGHKDGGQKKNFKNKKKNFSKKRKAAPHKPS